MPPIIVIGHLKTLGGEARQKVKDALVKASVYAAAHEPGVTKYCIMLPQDGEGDETSVFAFEEYADQEAMDKHMACPAVVELIKLFGSEPSLFAEAPAIYGLPGKLSAFKTFTRPSVTRVPDPFVVFANFEYKPNLVSQSIPGWTALIASAEKNEPGTLSYTALADEEKGWVRTIEAYESSEYLYGTHVKSAAIDENQKQNGEMRTGKTEVHRLKIVAGYLWKEGNKSRL